MAEHYNMSDSIEYRTLVQCREKLVTALKLDAVTVANALVSKNLIPPAVSSEIGELATSQGKANRLVDCIFAKVRISHTHYHSFVALFSQHGWLSDIVETLTSTYQMSLNAVSLDTNISDGHINESRISPRSQAISHHGQLSVVSEHGDQVHSEIGLAVIRSNEERIKALFSALLLNVQTILEAKNVVISRMRQFLVNFLQCEECLPRRISSLDDMFTAITMNGLWSYQHYSPLERLTDHFLPEEPQIKGFMRDYKSQLAGFFLTTKLVDFIEYKQLQARESGHGSQKQSALKKYTTEHYRKIKIRLEMSRRLSELSLEYVNKLWCSLAEEYDLPSLTAIIDKIVDGSLEITWLLPPHMAVMIKPRAKFFRRYQIIQVFIEDMIIYDEKEMIDNERRLLELCREATAEVSHLSCLLEKGTDPDIHDKYGKHPLWYASKNGRADVVETLLKSRADVNLATNDGETALINSSRMGHTEVIQLLLKNGADANYTDKNGATAFDIAKLYGHHQVSEDLKQHSASQKIQTKIAQSFTMESSLTTGRRLQHHHQEMDDSTLFITVKGSKLPDYITGQHLKQHFEQFKHIIVNSSVQREKDTMKSKGYAFINFTSSTAASLAMQTLQGSLLRGKFPLKIKKCVRKPPAYEGAGCVTDSDTESDTVSDSDSDSTNTTLYVGVFDSKFPNYVNSRHLREHFSEFEHSIENAMIVRDMKTKQTKGYGFVTFTSHAAAELVMKKYRSSKLHGKFKLFINFKGSKGSASRTLSSTTPSLSPSRASSTVDLSCFLEDETEQSEGDCKLYVNVNRSKFPNYINSRHLEAHFSEYKDHIKKAIIVRDFRTKRSKGYGFVTFKSQSVAETAMKRLHGSKLDGKFSLFISIKKDDMEWQSSPVEDEKVLVPLSQSTEELLYLRYRFYTSPTIASLALKKSLSAELMLRENTLYLYGTQSAVSRSTSQIRASTLLQNLQTLAFHGTWNQTFIIQLQDSILPKINESEEDVVCILSSQHEQGPNSISFTVQIFSHNYKNLQEAHRKLNELKPQSKLFQLRPEYQTVPGLTDAFLSFGKNHHTRIEKESGHGVRIHGVKFDDIQTCWTALKTFVDSNIIVTNSISVGFWEANYLQTRCSKFICTLEAEGCKVQIPVLTAVQQQGKVKIVLTGKLKATKQAGEKITNRCSLVLVQSVNLSCSTNYLSIWTNRWKEFIEEQSKINSSVLIEYQHKHQPGNSQVIEFTVVGIDSAAVAKAKNELIQRENGSKEKLAKLDLTTTSEEFIVLSNNLKECEAKLKQSHSVLVIVELDSSNKCVQVITTPNKKAMLDALQADIMSFIASKIPAAHKSTTKEIKFKDEIIGTLLTSKTKHLSMIEQDGYVFSVDVQPDQSLPNEFTLRLTGSGVNVRAVELTVESIIKKLKTTIAHAQLVVGEHNVSITSTDTFKSFCSQLLKELHVHCMYYPQVGGNLLRQVHLQSKAGHIVTLQIAIGQLSDERVDAIVVPAESRDNTMTNVEMNFEYFKYLQSKSLVVGEVACLDSGSFPSKKALYVHLPKRCQQLDFVAACTKTLNRASFNEFGSLSFPALGVDGIHNVSSTLCVNTLLSCIDKHCLENKSSTLHTIRIVITQDLHSTFLSCFDKYSFRATQEGISDSSDGQEVAAALSSPEYEWYWEDDKKQFTQYSPTVSKALTAAKLENPDSRHLLKVGGKSYIVDLSTMTQRNVSSGYVRKVMCKQVSSVSKSITSSANARCEVQWYYRDDQRTFAAYSQADSAKIEGIYQKVSRAGTYLQIKSRMYTFDFENMKQINFSTKYQRDIKREEVPIEESKEAEQGEEDELSQCVINLRGPEENLQTAKQRIKDKLESLSAFKNVPLPPASTPILKQKLFPIARRHSVSSSIRDDEKSKPLGASNQRSSQVFRIEGAEHLVDKAVTEVQGEIIEFHSQSSTASSAQADIRYPTEWVAQTSTSQLFKLDKYSREWIRVTFKFKETMPDADIVSVQRIQNKWLWERYSQHKERIREKNDGVVNEKELWHGSSKSSSDNIYNSEEGFDMRYSSKGLWGLANYFAEKASYSNKYAFTSPDGTKELLLAKVLTGDSFECTSDPSLRMPPEKPRSLKASTVQLKQLRYDSVTGTTCNCRVYMTYSNDKAYPAYLISYSTTPKPSYQVPPPPTQSQALFARLQAQFSGFTQ